ncbi:MAG: ATP-binding cassette domain-containing protein, partial [Planctomycetota bacterium]
SDCSPEPLDRRRVGYVTQDALLFPHLTVRGNLLYSPRADGPGDIAAALGIGHLLGRMPRNLSAGERRRVAVGRAILSRPRVLLLDEPFGGLDETRRREAMSWLDRVRGKVDLPMILVSHLADEIVGLTDWAVRLEEGRVVASGPSVSVLRSSETRIDNYLTGRVVAPGRVRVDGIELTAVLPQGASGEVRLACYAPDVILAAESPRGISARNVFPVRVVSVVPAGDAVLVEIERPALRALLTAEAVGRLDLRPGGEAVAVLKATSFAYLGPD